ncbi:MAG: hypothetical protein DRQ39_00630 [Gammaproteobacteria bacterium]|nr:MAG: hypothetical protein DRQ39_00630 [Gammaproteobacteria bacterium]RKZ95486.1 MAG: hypothetical protein DRQ40_03520 [Gammaproteobacteria bacterium]RLA00510.1 MAG: hypothetical protein DRQ42_05365 [Gammaproteobacteria bacterium]
MVRVKAEIRVKSYYPIQILKFHSGNLKAARMFLSVAAVQQGGNNGCWERTLQNFSDYLIRY